MLGPRRLLLFFLGGILAHHGTSSPNPTSPDWVSCKDANFPAAYQHCRVSSPGGVSGLQCVGKHHSRGELNCTWRRGASRSSPSVFMLVVQQSRGYCRVYRNTKVTKVFHDYNMTAQVLELVGSNCTKDVFTAHPHSLLHCGPPRHVDFKRHSESVEVLVDWPQEDAKNVRSFCVQHKTADGRTHKQVCCESATVCQLAPVNASEAYQVQVRCEKSDKCSQCPWSDVYALPPELTRPPVIVRVDQKMSDRTGQRTLSLAWTFPDAEVHDGYYVSVAKASGEPLREPPREHVNRLHPHVTLVLSFSSFHVDVSAFNNASESPAARVTVLPIVAGGDGMLNVSVHSDESFTVFSRDDLVGSNECFSVEWSSEGRPAAYRSFFEDTKNSWTLSPGPERPEAYRRYNVWLHVRPQSTPCNLKSVNNSEVTYAGAQFYFLEGPPLSAPANVSVANVTHNAMELRWSSIPQEELRGFLLGYVVHYMEDQQQETNVSVSAHVNSYTLEGLQSGTAYWVQVSGVTRAGAGVRSTAILVSTHERGSFSLIAVFIVSVVTAVVLVIVLLLIIIMKSKVKVVFWPNIPDPGESIAIQKLNLPSKMLLLESLTLLNVEECISTGALTVEVQLAAPEGAKLCPADEQSLPATTTYTSLDAMQQLMMMMQGTPWEVMAVKSGMDCDVVCLQSDYGPREGANVL
ncbi:interleukin-6 receptor subunit beta [Entelurus aequoreus]|uniref:interleukin-6 receptor subunit beta n=1 Tax=Entelurus aequoreus TaxID=161455 RepID=UPI002B1CEA59|nr:interleukin-6 receptor subunit beta [Entelurus aequoreus]